MRVFTIESGVVREGAIVSRYTLSNGVEIPVLTVGEEGRGRHLAIVPVHLQPTTHAAWKRGEKVCILHATIGQTQKGAPKVLEAAGSLPEENALCIFLTQIGFRGGNAHTGDATGETREDSWGYKVPVFAPFPGEIIAEGIIAQGDAGRMGSGEQLIAIMPQGVVFRTAYSGRLYGAPSEHFYIFDGERIISATREEREIADLF